LLAASECIQSGLRNRIKSINDHWDEKNIFSNKKIILWKKEVPEVFQYCNCSIRQHNHGRFDMRKEECKLKAGIICQSNRK